MEVCGSGSFPMMSTQELIDWAKARHPNVSIHAYDSTWRKFMKHIASIKPPICLVFYVKDHHVYPIQDDRLKHISELKIRRRRDSTTADLVEGAWGEVAVAMARIIALRKLARRRVVEAPFLVEVEK